MKHLTKEQIESYVKQYFDEMLAKNTNYIGDCDSAWIYDATDWLCMREEFQHDYLHEDSVRDFAKCAQLKWTELYNDYYGYKDNSYIFTSDVIKNDILKIKTEIKNAGEFLCSEKYTTHLTQEQLDKRKHEFRKLEVMINGVLWALNKITNELRLEDPVEAVDIANGMAADDIINSMS